MKQYMVERYLPDVTAAQLDDTSERLAAAARALAAEGIKVRYVGSTFIPQEDSCFSKFESASEDHVRRACSRAQVPFAHILETRDLGLTGESHEDPAPDNHRRCHRTRRDPAAGAARLAPSPARPLSHLRRRFVMNRIHRIHPIRRAAAILAGLTGALLAFTAAAPAAFAVHEPPTDGPAGPAQAPPHLHTIVVGGMPGWQITLIAVAAALLAAAMAVIVDRARAARQHATAPAA